MDQNSSFGAYLLRLLDSMASTAVLLQLGAIVIAAVLAWLLHHRAGIYVQREPVAAHGARDLLVHAAQRLTFPVATLLLLLVARGVFTQLDWNVGLLDVATPLLLSLAAIRALVYLLQKSFGPRRGLKAWESVISTTIWALVALHLLGWLPELLAWMDELALTVGQARISLLTVCKLAVSVALFLLLALWIARLIERKLEQSVQLDTGTRIGLAKFSKFMLLTLALLIALNSAGIDLTALTVFGGAIGVGLGFGLQRIASNVVSGFILVFERSIRPGDVVSIGESFGEVKELHARYVVVRDRDGVETLIPNENLITSQVINWTYSDRRVRIRIPVQVSYDDDPERAMHLMLEAARANSRILPDPAPICLLKEFGDNGINLELRVWINDPEEGVTNVRSAVNLAIWRAFKDNNITIPFPQRDVHIKTLPGQPSAITNVTHP